MPNENQRASPSPPPACLTLASPLVLFVIFLGSALPRARASVPAPGVAPVPAPDAPSTSSSDGPGHLVLELERLTEGLIVMSESDFPMDVVIWQRPGGKPSARRLAALIGHPHPETASTVPVDDFFRAAAAPLRGSDDAEARATIRRLERIASFLKRHLPDARVFRFGRSTMRAYVIGTTPSGDWLGIATTLIET